MFVLSEQVAYVLKIKTPTIKVTLNVLTGWRFRSVIFFLNSKASCPSNPIFRLPLDSFLTGCSAHLQLHITAPSSGKGRQGTHVTYFGYHIKWPQIYGFIVKTAMYYSLYAISLGADDEYQKLTESYF